MRGVTVLMPVFNGERFLQEAIESILQQTHRDFELLIINDGSTDRSRDIILTFDDPRITLVENPGNLGLAATLNVGLGLAKHELIARQDADDLSLPERLARQVDFLEKNPSVVLVGTQAVIIDQQGFRKGRVLDRACTHDSIRWDLLFDNSFTHSSVMFRRSIIAQLGGYDMAFRYCQDYALWTQVARHHCVANIDDCLVHYRVHPFDRMSDKLRGLIAAENRLIMRDYIADTLGNDSVSESELDAMVNMRLAFESRWIRSFAGLVTRFIEAYQAMSPSTNLSLDFKRTVARRYVRAAYKAWLSRPWCVLAILAPAVGRYPVVRVTVHWLVDLMCSMASDTFRHRARKLRVACIANW
jgi:glycosyltransferase involved in cell wall biosynthesis